MTTPIRWALLALCVLLTLGLYLWPDYAVSDTQPAAGGEREVSGLDRIDADPRPELRVEERTLVSRESIPATRTSRESMARIPGKMVIIGRCLRAGDGGPLANCEVFLVEPTSFYVRLPGP